jgi:signal recognition particle subunit SRP54
MFESLSDRFEGIFTRLRGRGRLGEDEVDEVLREIRLALLEQRKSYWNWRRKRRRAIGRRDLKIWPATM